MCWPPGSEWLYAKLYMAPDLTDELIGGPLRALTRELTDTRRVFSWFFLRFVDPDFHVRLRMRGDPATLTTSVLPRMCEWAQRLVEQRTLERFALDTYEPEIERYGGPAGVLLAERAFAADSVAVAELVARREAILSEIDWAQLGAWTVDDLLDALGIRRDERASWYRGRYAIYEHASEFRSARTLLRALLDSGDAPRGGHARDLVTAILVQRRAALRDVARGFDELTRREQLSLPLADIAASLVHMHCNRLCAAATDVESKIVGLAGLTAASLVAWPPSRRPLV
ncbi:MAG TPA: thiopeptide-type bacteriocin biosynthesis protein [Baekduia sp.]|nr:thiopeptide-type bacteriocin biosynthesis protein [Baekduia sp.]